jgi:hypothetical protein
MQARDAGGDQLTDLVFLHLLEQLDQDGGQFVLVKGKREEVVILLARLDRFGCEPFREVGEQHFIIHYHC